MWVLFKNGFTKTVVFIRDLWIRELSSDTLFMLIYFLSVKQLQVHHFFFFYFLYTKKHAFFSFAWSCILQHPRSLKQGSHKVKLMYSIIFKVPAKFVLTAGWSSNIKWRHNFFFLWQITVKNSGTEMDAYDGSEIF